MKYYLLPFWVEHWIHERSPGQEVVLQVVSDLPPPRELEGLHRGVLYVHVGVHAVPNQGLDDSVLGSSEVIIGPELETEDQGNDEECKNNFEVWMSWLRPNAYRCSTKAELTQW